MADYDSPYDKLRAEFDTLMALNNEPLRELPEYTIAQLYQLVDQYRMKHGVDLTEVRQEDNGVYMLMLAGSEIDKQAAVLGADSPEKVADLDVAMLDDRDYWGTP